MRVTDFRKNINNLFKFDKKAILVFSGVTLVLIVSVVCLSFRFVRGSDHTGKLPEPESGLLSNTPLPDRQFVPVPVRQGQSMVYFKPDKTAVAGKPFEFSILAADADGDTLLYSAAGLPNGASFDPATRTFSWTPRFDQAGVYSVHFQVTDGEFTDSEDITISVVQSHPDWDVNGDSSANVLDMVLVGQCWGNTGQTGWRIEDTNEDGSINVLDMIVIGQHWTG